MDPVTITIGTSGHSDVVLAELQGAAEQLGCQVREAAILLIGAGLQALQMQGTIKRVTPPGRGLDPAPLRHDEIATVRATAQRVFDAYITVRDHERGDEWAEVDAAIVQLREALAR